MNDEVKKNPSWHGLPFHQKKPDIKSFSLADINPTVTMTDCLILCQLNEPNLKAHTACITITENHSTLR